MVEDATASIGVPNGDNTTSVDTAKADMLLQGVKFVSTEEVLTSTRTHAHTHTHTHTEHVYRAGGPSRLREGVEDVECRSLWRCSVAQKSHPRRQSSRVTARLLRRPDRKRARSPDRQRAS